MAVNATDAIPGNYYRRTKSPRPGAFYMRPRSSKRNTPQAWVARQVNKGDALAGYWASQLRNCPDSILLVSYTRGTDSFTGKRWEVKRTVLVPPDTRLRQVKSRPGYTRDGRAT